MVQAAAQEAAEPARVDQAGKGSKAAAAVRAAEAATSNPASGGAVPAQLQV